MSDEHKDFPVIHFGVKFGEPTLCGAALCGEPRPDIHHVHWSTSWQWDTLGWNRPDHITCPKCVALKPLQPPTLPE